MGTQCATPTSELKLEAPADLAWLGFTGPVLCANPDRAESVRLAVEKAFCLAASPNLGKGCAQLLDFACQLSRGATSTESAAEIPHRHSSSRALISPASDLSQPVLASRRRSLAHGTLWSTGGTPLNAVPIQHRETVQSISHTPRCKASATIYAPCCNMDGVKSGEREDEGLRRRSLSSDAPGAIRRSCFCGQVVGT